MLNRAQREKSAVARSHAFEKGTKLQTLQHMHYESKASASSGYIITTKDGGVIKTSLAPNEVSRPANASLSHKIQTSLAVPSMSQLSGGGQVTTAHTHEFSSIPGA